MRILKGIFKALPLVLLSSISAASDWHFGGYIKAGEYGVKDPDGDTETTSNATPGIKIAYDLDARGQRLFSAFEYVSFSLDSEPDSVAQDVKGYTLLGGYERKFAISRSIKIWLSGALGASSVDFTDRAAIASDGYLEEWLEDRSKNYFSGSIALDTYFDVTDTWQLGVGLFADLPIGDGVEAAGIKITVQQY